MGVVKFVAPAREPQLIGKYHVSPELSVALFKKFKGYTEVEPEGRVTWCIESRLGWPKKAKSRSPAGQDCQTAVLVVTVY
jgi:hypothetical protein